MTNEITITRDETDPGAYSVDVGSLAVGDVYAACYSTAGEDGEDIVMYAGRSGSRWTGRYETPRDAAVALIEMKGGLDYWRARAVKVRRAVEAD